MRVRLEEAKTIQLEEGSDCFAVKWGKIIEKRKDPAFNTPIPPVQTKKCKLTLLFTKKKVSGGKLSI
jgi:hypothetical protein